MGTYDMEPAQNVGLGIPAFIRGPEFDFENIFRVCGELTLLKPLEGKTPAQIKSSMLDETKKY